MTVPGAQPSENGTAGRPEPHGRQVDLGLQHADQLLLVSDVVGGPPQRDVDLVHPVAAHRGVEPDRAEIGLDQRPVAGQRHRPTFGLDGPQARVGAGDQHGDAEADRTDHESTDRQEEELTHVTIVARWP